MHLRILLYRNDDKDRRTCLQEANLGNAQDRAALALQIAQYLCSIEDMKPEDAGENEQDNEAILKKTIDFIREFSQPVDIEEQEHGGT